MSIDIEELKNNWLQNIKDAKYQCEQDIEIRFDQLEYIIKALEQLQAELNFKQAEIDGLRRTRDMWKKQSTISEAEIEKLKNQWISVDDRYPDKKGRYLVIIDNMYRTQKICRYFPCDRFIQSDFMPVTHWQPLPKPPEGE